MSVGRAVQCIIMASFVAALYLGNELAPADQSVMIKVVGSSTLYPMTEAVAEEFRMPMGERFA